ncbi:hypothetical protein DICPUDRAFT_48259 [Dictyostelium purpureum]|uniref:Inhibitor of growth protein n=1 Tax=Dictyostelium purpureum TaxID=5786 RepID=F0ZNF5_DICPU|nr:uncharacterized protein DICPUDRAFT_48259 [Dictyostelium purpureum]EGC34523.1 hypothetical protein DICPUDRAFT_48259 [Dictyostelium purpureum]|eukprot:XP_003288959.1 hypothetical protein DICPUDRAFT_48259 [Dictyostelium purpureum]
MYQGKGTYLENYLDTISTLPSELNRNFALIRELDYRSYELVDKIEKLKNNLLVNTNSTRKVIHNLTDEKSSKQIKNELKQILEYSDEKVELSNQTYELIDRHIRKLDADLKKFEVELETMEEEKKKKKSKQASASETTQQNKKGKARETLTSSTNTSGSLSRKKSQQEITSITGNNTSDIKVFNANQGDLDLAIDPNEPTYCFCNRVSFGEMVGCENPDCKIEWFHFECVGLTSNPKGKWFCPDCTKKKSNK